MQSSYLIVLVLLLSTYLSTSPQNNAEGTNPAPPKTSTSPYFTCQSTPSVYIESSSFTLLDTVLSESSSYQLSDLACDQSESVNNPYTIDLECITNSIDESGDDNYNRLCNRPWTTNRHCKRFCVFSLVTLIVSGCVASLCIKYINKLDRICRHFRSTIVISIFLFRLQSTTASLTWTESKSISLISDKFGMAIGAHNGSIWLAGGGGGSGATELIKINIITETASSYDSNGYTFGNLGAQMWFQRGTVLFTSYYLKGAIRGFDLSSMTVTHIITKYDTVYDGAHCLTGNNDYLFTVGGWSGDIYVDAFYIYNFISEEWFVGPSIPQ
eukprot:123899_1